ncbi:MAG: hypothetical protein OSA52_09500 [Yoonia sp.]|nr:hypothetical protein [Yoonia sp.]
MRAIVILIAAAILGFFGYQYAANGNTPAAAISAVTGATAAAEEAAAAATAAAEEAAAAATAAAEEAAAATAAAAEEAAATAAAEVAAAEVAAEEAAATAAAETGMADLLTADGFDADKVIEMISNSDLSAVQQTVLSGAVNAIKDNPALLEATLTRLKEALGQ